MTLLCNHPRPFLSRIRFTGMSASSSSKQIGPSDETGTICIAIYRVKLTVGDKDSLWTQRYAEKGFSELVDRESRKKACSHMIGYVSVNRTIIHGLSGVSPNSLSDKTVEYGHESSEYTTSRISTGKQIRAPYSGLCIVNEVGSIIYIQEKYFLLFVSRVPAISRYHSGTIVKKAEIPNTPKPRKYISDCKSSASKRARGTQDVAQNSEAAGDLAWKLESRRLKSIRRLEVIR